MITEEVAPRIGSSICSGIAPLSSASGGGAAIGLAEGRYDVAKVHPNGRVDLSDGRKRFRIDPQRLSPTDTRDRLQLSERKDLHLREGERIRWTANDKPRGLLNAALARVLAVDARGVTVDGQPVDPFGRAGVGEVRLCKHVGAAQHA